MNYSDFDSDGYSSNEDADYVPSGDNLSEDDINECEKEDPLHEDDSVPHPDNVSKKKRKGKDNKMRKRKIKVLKVDKDDDGTEEPELLREEVEKNTEDEDDHEERQKKKSDDLWASFLSDAGSKPKDSSSASLSVQNANSSVLKVAPLNTATKAPGPSKVTITKVFDFAGEEVRVNKEVAADSKEARSYLKSKNTKQENEDDERNSSFSQTPKSKSLAGPSATRPTGMSSILNRIGGKKQKMNTLEKSKMDWDAYKSEEGITEDLAIHNRGKEGYVERKNFLERVDHRQFELEKAVRLSNMKQ